MSGQIKVSGQTQAGRAHAMVYVILATEQHIRLVANTALASIRTINLFHEL